MWGSLRCSTLFVTTGWHVDKHNQLMWTVTPVCHLRYIMSKRVKKSLTRCAEYINQTNITKFTHLGKKKVLALCANIRSTATTYSLAKCNTLQLITNTSCNSVALIINVKHKLPTVPLRCRQTILNTNWDTPGPTLLPFEPVVDSWTDVITSTVRTTAWIKCSG